MIEETIISIRDRLLKERQTLLDLSTRNRLLNIPMRTRNVRTIEIVDEKTAEVFRILSEGKSMTFLPGIQLSGDDRAGLDADDLETGGIPQPSEAEAVDERGVAARHSDNRLQTRLTSQGLQKRLFDIWYDARTLEEEQGVNILYLAMGLLRWYDSESSDIARHAPLVLFPVQLDRSSAAERFHLKWRSEPPSPNLTFQAKMKTEFGIVVEDFDDEDSVDLAAYFQKVAQTVSKQERWEVLPDAMVLGFFSFSKFLMYRDLDPDHWPEQTGIDGHPLITALLRDGFPESEPLVPENVSIDAAIPALELNHVVDADSSQAVAIAEASRGRTLVVKGPPGTGKSQTITNVIAACVARGRKVLFVAEKMAALDVVYRRLKQCGLGPLTFELHSNKVNKRTVLEELKRTKDAADRGARSDVTIIQKLGETTDELNAFAQRLHTPLQPSGLTPYQILGRLIYVQDGNSQASLTLEGAEAWTDSDFAERVALVTEIAERLRDLGLPSSHPWRGVRCEPLAPPERDEICREAQALLDQLSEVRSQATVAKDALGAPDLNALGDAGWALSFLDIARTAPSHLDGPAMAHPAWKSGLADIKALLVAGRHFSAKRADIEPVLTDAGWDADLAPIRIQIAMRGASWLRVLYRDYRTAVALLRSYLKTPWPKTMVERLALIDRLMAAQKAKADFVSAPQVGEAFGRNWKAAESDWAALDAIVAWRHLGDALPEEIWARFAQSDVGALAKAANVLESALARSRQLFGTISHMLDLDMKRAFGAASIEIVPLIRLQETLTTWIHEREALLRFVAFAARCRVLANKGCSALMEAVHDGVLDHKALPQAFQRSYTEVLRKRLFDDWPALRAFDGDTQARIVQQFRQLDRARIEVAKEQIAAAHSEKRPRSNAGVGPLGVLNAELAKKRGHLPIRQLLERAGPVIQQLKPVFMMSPLSVAQFLKPGGLTFDVLIMDEASQIEPVDALGAVARVQQLVVVGDERQLPPTTFFRKLTGDEDEKDDDTDGVTIQAKDAESILDLCLARGVPYRMLNWHYRSKHQSLIAVSNKEFYENKLFIVPSPYDAIAGMGLKFHLLKDAAYDRGGTRTNQAEARIVAEAVMRHAVETPEQSLGVAAFSVSQRQAILKELELLRRAHPEAEDFFSPNTAEPFFVKNLENIQGDERDVIFISIGYGKTEQGYLAHAFGPLSSEGGERRLNVLISRAKIRCEVFSNFTGADIDLERTRARGVAALKLFLTFAETGKFGQGESLTWEHDSEFEAQVCDRLRALGYDVKPQIGASGFRVDLGVSDPEKPGRFVLGIECDGKQYHSSRSARDRDRLRQQVLEAHGWIIHRIWSADWYLRPQEELRKVEAAIAAAKAEWRERDEASVLKPKAVPLSFEVEETKDAAVITPVLGEGPKPEATPTRVAYVEASFPVNTSVEPHQVPTADMAAYVIKIVQAEGPVHVDEIAGRIRDLWGLQRAGSRIRAVVGSAARIAEQRGLLQGGPFYMAPGQKVVVRDRSEVSSTTLRRPEMLPPVEIEQAHLSIVDECFGAKRDELIQAASRAFGFASTSAQLRAVLEDGIDRLLANKRLETKDEMLVLVKTDDTPSSVH